MEGEVLILKTARNKKEVSPELLDLSLATLLNADFIGYFCLCFYTSE
jgi:hypothetical protein